MDEGYENKARAADAAQTLDATPPSGSVQNGTITCGMIPSERTARPDATQSFDATPPSGSVQNGTITCGMIPSERTAVPTEKTSTGDGSCHASSSKATGSANTKKTGSANAIKVAYRKSSSGADLLTGHSEWWSEDPTRFQRKPSTPEGQAKDHGDAVLREKEWWREDSGASGSEEIVVLQEGWWGTHPEVEQADGPRTSRCQHGCLGVLRRKVSGGRNRYRIHGFDLDLTYITSRIVAMGFPAGGSRTVFRNPRSEVAKFLQWKHKDTFRIYNLCVEPAYRYNGFPEQTVDYPSPDHCPQSLSMMIDFCRNAQEWIQAGKDNVVVVHCKAGKGRSGTFICCLLVYAGAVNSAYEALRWFAMVRGGKREGVTIPSQIRFIAMFERWLRQGAGGLRSNPMPDAGKHLDPVPHRLKTVRLGPVLDAFLRTRTSPDGTRRRTANVRIGLTDRVTFANKKGGRVKRWYEVQDVEADEEGILECNLPEDWLVWEEADGLVVVEVRGIKRGCSLRKPKPLTASAWWCHAFLERDEANLVQELPKPCVDTLARDMRKNKKAPENFRFSVIFEDLRKVQEDGTRTLPLEGTPVSDQSFELRVETPTGNSTKLEEDEPEVISPTRTTI